MADTFNPDAYLEAKGVENNSNTNVAPPSINPDAIQQREFDPDQYLAQKGSTAYDINQAKYGTLPQQALAGEEALERGLSFGLSDVARTKIEPALGLPENLQSTPEGLAGRAEANPVTSGALNVVSGAAPMVATGGLGGLLPEGAGTVAKLAAAAGEGGLFGAGNAVSDYAMGDPSLNAQKVLSYIGTGMAFGTGFGALSKISEAYLPIAATKLQNSLGKLKDSIFGNAETPGLVSKIATDWAQEFRNGIETGNLDPKVATRELITNLQDIHNAAKQAATDLYEKAAPANIGEALKDMPVEQAKGLAQQTIDKIKDLTIPGEGMEQTPPLSQSSATAVTTRLQTLGENLSSAKTALDVHNALSDFATDLDKGKLIKFDTMPTASQMADQEVLRNVRNAIRGDLKDNSLWGDAATHYSQISEDYAAYKNSLKNFQSAFMKREIAPNGTKRFVIDPGKINSFFSNYTAVGQDLKKGYLNDFIDQSTNLAKASENYAGFIKGAEDLSDHVESLSGKNKELSGLAQKMAGKTAAHPSGSFLNDAVLGVGAHAIGVPDPIVGGALGALEAYRVLKNPYKFGATFGNTLNKLKGLGNIIDKVTNSISAGAKSIFNTGAVRGAITHLGTQPSYANYDKNTKRIQQLATNPQDLTDHLSKITEPLYEAAPNITQGLHTSTIAGIQFLNSKIPRPNNELPMSQKWEPTKSQKAEFNRYFQAVDDPLSILKQIKDGTLSNEAMQALQVVHPDLLKEMQQKVVENINPKTSKNVNYSTKLSLGRFLGMPMDESMIPQVIMASQANFATPANQQAAGAPKRKSSTLGGLEKLSLSKRAATQTQRDEAED